jgi:hypothetical protein
MGRAEVRQGFTTEETARSCEKFCPLTPTAHRLNLTLREMPCHEGLA